MQRQAVVHCLRLFHVVASRFNCVSIHAGTMRCKYAEGRVVLLSAAACVHAQAGKAMQAVLPRTAALA